MVFLSLSFISNEQQQQTQGLQTSNDNVRYGTDWKSMSLLFQLSKLIKTIVMLLFNVQNYFPLQF